MPKEKHFLELLISHEDWMKLWDITPEGKSMANVAEEALHNFIAAQHRLAADASPRQEIPAEPVCVVCGEAIGSNGHIEIGNPELTMCGNHWNALGGMVRR